MLALTLQGGVVKDGRNRTGYIASNRQFQFDTPPQSGAVYTAGFSLCVDGSFALGEVVTWFACDSGTFSNLYDAWVAPQCRDVYLRAVPLIDCLSGKFNGTLYPDNSTSSLTTPVTISHTIPSGTTMTPKPPTLPHVIRQTFPPKTLTVKTTATLSIRAQESSVDDNASNVRRSESESDKKKPKDMEQLKEELKPWISYLQHICPTKKNMNIKTPSTPVLSEAGSTPFFPNIVNMVHNPGNTTDEQGKLVQGLENVLKLQSLYLEQVRKWLNKKHISTTCMKQEQRKRLYTAAAIMQKVKPEELSHIEDHVAFMPLWIIGDNAN